MCSANLATEQVLRPLGPALFRSCLIPHGYRGPHHGLRGGLFWNPQAVAIGVLLRILLVTQTSSDL